MPARLPIFIDIETACADPAAWTPPPIEAPSNYKDEAKIAAYVAEKQAEAYGKSGLDSHRGRMLCLGIAVGDGPVSVHYDETLNEPKALLDPLHQALVQNGGGPLVGHNIAAFDVPWLWRTAVRIGHPAARWIPYRKWGEGLHDTMQMWSVTNPREYVSLDTIARFLGLPGKPEGITGASVWPMYQEGRHEEIRRYCAGDVETTRAIYRRITGGE